MLYDVWIAMSNAISTSTATGSVNQSRLIISKKPWTVPDRENKAVVSWLRDQYNRGTEFT